MQPATHIIGRQRVRLNYSGPQDPLALRQSISQLFQELLPAKLNEIFDRLAGPDVVIRLDTLKLNIRIAEGEDLEAQLLSALTEELTIALEKSSGATSAATLETSTQSFRKTLVFYLERGFLPWWAAAKDYEGFQEILRQQLEASGVEQLLILIAPILLQHHPRQRLIGLLKPDGVAAMLQAGGVLSQQRWQAWQRSLEESFPQLASATRQKAADRFLAEATLITLPETQIAGVFEKHLAGATLALSAQQRRPPAVERLKAISDPVIRNLLQDALPLRGKYTAIPIPVTKPEAPSVAEKKEEAAQTIDEARLLTGTAGLVLIANFLPQLFRQLKLLAADDLTDPARAVQVLSFLATGADACPELELALEKILCGLPLHQSLPPWLPPLSSTEKEECEALLQAAISHWKALKNTSPDGLRHNFLQREGRLLFQNNNWQLAVQQQTHDLLLDFLPWSSSMIKLPWMTHLMLVKWRD